MVDREFLSHYLQLSVLFVFLLVVVRGTLFSWEGDIVYGLTYIGTILVLILFSLQLSIYLFDQLEIHPSSAFLFMIFAGVLISILLLIVEIFSLPVEITNYSLSLLVMSFIILFSIITLRWREETIASARRKH